MEGYETLYTNTEMGILKNMRGITRYSQLSGRLMDDLYENVTPNKPDPLEEIIQLGK